MQSRIAILDEEFMIYRIDCTLDNGDQYVLHVQFVPDYVDVGDQHNVTYFYANSSNKSTRSIADVTYIVFNSNIDIPTMISDFNPATSSFEFINIEESTTVKTFNDFQPYTLANRADVVTLLMAMENNQIITKNEAGMLWGLLTDKTTSADNMVYAALQSKIKELHYILCDLEARDYLNYEHETLIKREIEAGNFGNYIALVESVRLAEKIAARRLAYDDLYAKGLITDIQRKILELLVDGQFFDHFDYYLKSFVDTTSQIAV